MNPHTLYHQRPSSQHIHQLCTSHLLATQSPVFVQYLLPHFNDEHTTHASFSRTMIASYNVVLNSERMLLYTSVHAFSAMQCVRMHIARNFTPRRAENAHTLCRHIYAVVMSDRFGCAGPVCLIRRPRISSEIEGNMCRKYGRTLVGDIHMHT